MSADSATHGMQSPISSKADDVKNRLAISPRKSYYVKLNILLLFGAIKFA